MAIRGGTLWQRFDAVAVGSVGTWWLAVPLPALDEATLYYRDGGGQSQRQEAGDSRAISRWALRGRYPVFALPAEVGVPMRYYLQLRHSRVPFSALPFAINDAGLITLRQNEHMLLGIYFGLAILAVALATANAVAYRDSGFAAYAVHVAALSGAQAVLTGLASLYLWPELPQLNNASAIFLASLSAASALLFVCIIGELQRLAPRLDALMKALILALLACGIANALMLSELAFVAYNTVLALSVAVTAVGVVLAAWRSDADLRWLVLGFLPVSVAAVFPVLHNYGLIEFGFLTQYALMTALAVQAPVLFYGLCQRLTGRLLPSVRASDMQVIDPLTGLHSSPVLAHRLQAVMNAAQRHQQPFAVLMISLVNQASLQAAHGREVGERAIVTAAARIRSVARPSDMVARVGDAQFALLMAGPVTAGAVNDYATKLLASGLRPSDDLPNSNGLQFHIAVGHIEAQDTALAPDAETLLARMLTALHGMNGGSPRRFGGFVCRAAVLDAPSGIFKQPRWCG